MSRGSIVLPPPAIGADGNPLLPPHLAGQPSQGSSAGSHPASGKLGGTPSAERPGGPTQGRARMNSVTL